MKFNRGDYVIHRGEQFIVQVDHDFGRVFCGRVVDARSELSMGEYCVDWSTSEFTKTASEKLPVQLIKNEIICELYWADREPEIKGIEYILDKAFGKDCCPHDQQNSTWPNHSIVKITVEELERISKAD